ncbi:MULTISPECIES: 3-hydroxyacyl-CoA dehydrogenase/enoyl-CoA hydratase family protein [Calothrix]|uniref:Enoyl-CoA hydratase/isomerase family protein n=2 Tax=Calothrix TaxID=1186 RepID=A0ABR8AD41_9CYAN|nr:MULTISPECIES: 3-hydroxyacyl-CoA dehydrogenase/enoyl-CoA hydratase family protein [Calothrix]MBD2197679.1 enoyl-CoA hydratase/isomerase family protein [Calothrix parietina FACHB-288]MBD2225608.1 enoyl-CoA hydratase/isomerase family protein [Calothrix anomala FACHB-343]
MFKPFRTAAVLGAGVMGTQIAAHLANAGLTVQLLDIAAKGGNKNEIVETAFKKALKQSPPILFTEKTARRIILGNFDEHFHRIANVDWVIEVVVENLAIKQDLMARIESTIRDDAVVSTNTSGLPINEIAQGRSEAFRQRFLGTHFFNPPRYLKLLELIPTPDTDTQILARMQWFGRIHLGKGVVVAKDTPNFIANRIGMYATMLGIKGVTEQGYTIEEIDTLTGVIAGRPKSATFRTADLVGLDTLMYVARNLYPAIPDDESREVLRVPALMKKLVETGTLGAKTGQGFYKKQGKEILSINPTTLAYEAAKPLDLGDIEAIGKISDLGDRLRKLYHDPGRAGKFFRQSTLEILGYSARRIPEIADKPADIDRAIRWGFGWELGPFEIWDILGFETVLADMKAADISVPEWVEKMHDNGVHSFYRKDRLSWAEQKVVEACAVCISEQPKAPTDEILISAIKEDTKNILWENSEASLLDMGDGVVLYEFHSKGHTLTLKVVEGLAQVLDIIENSDYRGLVIGNESANFSGGANLAEMAMLAQTDNGKGIADLIVKFQALLQRIKYFPKPIVAAIVGRVLGGGCELVLACPHVVAAAETYIGLVELSVGLIPGAGGIMRMVTWANDKAASESPQDIQPFLRKVFETIGMAKVSSSAYEGQELGYLSPTTKIVMNSDRLLSVAKEEVLCLDRIGYTPPTERNAIMVLGRQARAMLEHAAYVMQQGGYISEYDHYLASRLAYVMTGGELTAPALVDEDYLSKLERESFLPLLHQPKTQERFAHTLKTKKPLRN